MTRMTWVTSLNRVWLPTAYRLPPLATACHPSIKQPNQNLFAISQPARPPVFLSIQTQAVAVAAPSETAGPVNPVTKTLPRQPEELPTPTYLNTLT